APPSTKIVFTSSSSSIGVEKVHHSEPNKAPATALERAANSCQSAYFSASMPVLYQRMRSLQLAGVLRSPLVGPASASFIAIYRFFRRETGEVLVLEASRAADFDAPFLGVFSGPTS